MKYPSILTTASERKAGRGRCSMRSRSRSGAARLTARLTIATNVGALTWGSGCKNCKVRAGRECFIPTTGMGVLKAWHESVANGTPYEQEERHRGFDGTYRWFLARGLPLRDGEGRIVRWYGTNTDIEDRRQAEQELRRLSGQLLRSQDEERRRIARDLHDSTGQDLVALATMLGELRASTPSSSPKSRGLVSECQALAEHCIREIRTLSYLLHPPMLDEAGLEDAIRHYLDGFTKRTGIRVDLEVSPGYKRMTPDIELALFRVVQESLTNVQRHSGSLQAKIRLVRNADEVTLEI